LKINRNGAAGWIYQGKAYLVCRTVANAVQDYLQDNGATDIPSDPTRLYDTWQEHGYAQENVDGGAIWKIAIDGEDYQLNLTVMVFEADRLFKVGHTPADMKGSITVLSQDTNIKKLSQASGSENKPEAETEQSPGTEPGTETVNQPSEQTQGSDPFDISNEQSTETDTDQTPGTGTAPDVSNRQETGTEPGALFTPSAQKSGSALSPAPDNEKTGAVSNDKILAQIEHKYTLDSGATPEKEVAIPDPNDQFIGEYFINWVKRSIRDKSLRVNRADTPVHIVAAGVVLVSPVILKKFCAQMGFDELTSNKATWKIVQARFHKLKLHIKTDNHVNIHKFQILGANRTSYMNGYLLPFAVIFPEGNQPDLNKKIIHVG
ncbi:MAG: DNA-binding domain-containing protein, partial [Gammaproteobacteria bacterium]|nr:DNA-binding domain-containing protein [Gammaproteobacteria bacterium]